MPSPVAVEDDVFLDDILQRGEEKAASAPAKPLNTQKPKEIEVGKADIQNPDDDAFLDSVLGIESKPKSSEKTSSEPAAKQKSDPRLEQYDTDSAAKDFSIDPFKLAMEDSNMLNEAADIIYKRQFLNPEDKPKFDWGKAAAAVPGAAAHAVKSAVVAPWKAAGNLAQTIAYLPSQLDAAQKQAIDSSYNSLEASQKGVNKFSKGFANLVQDYVPSPITMATFGLLKPTRFDDAVKGQNELALNQIESLGAIKSGFTGTADMFRKLYNAAEGGIQRAGQGGKLTREQVLTKLASDVEWQKEQDAINRGELKDSVSDKLLVQNKDAVLRATGVKQEDLERNISDLSFYTDPLDLAFVGAGGVASKVLPKLGAAAKAGKLGRTVERGMEAIEKTGEVAAKLTNKAKGAVYLAAGNVGVGAEKVLRSPLAQTAITAAAGYSTGGVPGAIGALVLNKLGGKKGVYNSIMDTVTKLNPGASMVAKGKRLMMGLDEAGKPGFLSRAGKYFQPEILGAGGGMAFAAPLLFGARDEEEFGSILGGAAGAGAFGGTQGRMARAMDVYYHAKTNPNFKKYLSSDNAVYGTNKQLDTLHAEALKNLPETEVADINMFRDALAGNKEIYVLPDAAYAEVVPQAKRTGGFYSDTDGRIYLRESTSALGHEFLHATFGEMFPNPKERNSAYHMLDKYYGKEMDQFKQRYEDKMNQKAIEAGTFDPESPYRMLDRDHLREEFMAEQMKILLRANPLDKFAQRTPLTELITKKTGELAEKVGHAILGKKHAIETLSKGLKEGYSLSSMGVIPSFIASNFLEGKVRQFLASKNAKFSGVGNSYTRSDRTLGANVPDPNLATDLVITPDGTKAEGDMVLDKGKGPVDMSKPAVSKVYADGRVALNQADEEMAHRNTRYEAPEGDLDASFDAVQQIVKQGEKSLEDGFIGLKKLENGDLKIIGSDFNPEDPLHQKLLAELSPEQREWVLKVSQAIKEGVSLNYIYDSAKGGGVTAYERATAQQHAPADKKARKKNGMLVHKSFIPTSFEIVPGKDSKYRILVNGISTDKIAHNADLIFQARDKIIDLADRRLIKGEEAAKILDYLALYKGSDDPRFLRDIEVYLNNHKNGYGGDGTRLEGIGVNDPDKVDIRVTMNPDYVPISLDENPAISARKLAVLNALFNNDLGTSKGGRTSGQKKTFEAKSLFAERNQRTKGDAGLFNPFLNEMQKIANKGHLDAKDRTLFNTLTQKGVKKALESPFERIKMSLMGSTPGFGQGLRSTPLAKALALMNTLPNLNYAAIGFSPEDSSLQNTQNVVGHQSSPVEFVSKLKTKDELRAGLNEFDPQQKSQFYKALKKERFKFGEGTFKGEDLFTFPAFPNDTLKNLLKQAHKPGFESFKNDLLSKGLLYENEIPEPVKVKTEAELRKEEVRREKTKDFFKNKKAKEVERSANFKKEYEANLQPLDDLGKLVGSDKDSYTFEVEYDRLFRVGNDWDSKREKTRIQVPKSKVQNQNGNLVAPGSTINELQLELDKLIDEKARSQ